MAPARDPHAIRFFDVLAAVTEHGSEMPHLGETTLMRQIDATYEKVKGDVRSSGDNTLLVDLIR
jgi:hypothetical protein